MDGRENHLAEVQWSQEGDAWIGVLGASGRADDLADVSGHDGFEVELMLRAEDWHVEVSHGATGGFEREHILAANAEEARAKAADLLRAYKARLSSE